MTEWKFDELVLSRLPTTDGVAEAGLDIGLGGINGLEWPEVPRIITGAMKGFQLGDNKEIVENSENPSAKVANVT